MGKMLSEKAINQYRRDGYYFPARALTGDEARRYHQRLEDFIARNETGIIPSRLLKSKAHLISTALYELIARRQILDAVEDVLGPDILCWASGVFRKQAQSPDFISWHQDATYWGLEPADVVTAWLALTDSTAVNGAMKVLPGSHKKLLPHADTFAEHNLLSRGQEIAVQVDENEAVDLVLDAGEFSLHHVRLAHGSKPNASDRPRVGFAIRYIAPHVCQQGGMRDSAILVRGEDRFGHFDADRPPRRDFEPEALRILTAAHNNTLRQTQSIPKENNP